MTFKHIVAILRPNVLQAVEDSLVHLGVPGITVTRTKGFGEYTDFAAGARSTFSSVCVEIFVEEEQVQPIVETIMNAAHTGTPGEGLVAVLPVDKLYWVRTRHEFGTMGPVLSA